MTSYSEENRREEAAEARLAPAVPDPAALDREIAAMLAREELEGQLAEWKAAAKVAVREDNPAAFAEACMAMVGVEKRLEKLAA